MATESFFLSLILLSFFLNVKLKLGELKMNEKKTFQNQLKLALQIKCLPQLHFFKIITTLILSLNIDLLYTIY